MTVYAAFEPPTGADPVLRAEATRLVADRFHWLACLLPPVFFVRHRLWLWLAAYVAAVIGLFALSPVLPDLAGPALLGLSILTGLEASELIGNGLVRRGWRPAGLVAGATLEEAERRFFARAHLPAPRATVAPAPLAPRPAGRPVIGFGM
jgi:Protein of unknown function (DUF2628)